VTFMNKWMCRTTATLRLVLLAAALVVAHILLSAGMRSPSAFFTRAVTWLFLILALARDNNLEETTHLC